MRKMINLFICGLILLSGCGTPSPSLPSELLEQKSNYPNTINIIAPDFFYITGAENSDQIKQQWLDEMSQRYGFKLDIISNYYTDKDHHDYSANDQVSDALNGNSSFQGLISISAIQEIKMGLDSDVLMPLEGFLAQNPTWNALPENFKSLFEIDGHIYAIPTYIFRGQYARIIHDEALAKYGITVTDLDSFYDFSAAYAQDTGNAALGSVGVKESDDILNAFGLYYGRTTGNAFSYDPTEDCYVDFLTKSAAVEALTYLRELYKAGALDISFGQDTGYANFNSGLFASNYRQYFDYENCTEVFTLNPAYPQIALTSTRGFAMTKNTPRPKETINLFVDMLFGSEQNYLDCWLGSSSNYTLNSDGTITVNMPQNSDGSFVYPSFPNLTGGLSDIFPYSDANLFFSQNGIISMKSETDAGEYNARFQLQYDSMKNGTIVEIPPLYQIIKSATYDANQRDIQYRYEECIKNAIINPDITVQQAVDRYREAMLNFGGNVMLDEMNAAIGKQTAYYYG